VNDQNGRYARLRYTATGALAALAAVGAIAGTVALAASPRTKRPSHAAIANCAAAKMPAPAGPGPGKGQAAQPGSSQPFLTDVQRLVARGTISATEGQVLDREIRAGGIDTQTLTSSGFTQAQLQAVQQTLGNTKRAMAQNAR
jgi:hypothetical protein